MTRQRLKTACWILSVLFITAACKQEVEIVEVVRAIKTITVQEQAAQLVFKFSGLVAAVDSSGLSFEVGGNVSSVRVDIGDRVKKGEVLAVLDPEPYKLEVDAIRAELVKARGEVDRSKAQYERHKRIYEQGAGAKSYLEVAEYQYTAAKSAVKYQLARLDLAKRNLRKTKLFSPYDGTIAWRSVNSNEEVMAGQKLFEINASGEMEVQLAVPETTIDLIYAGDTASITFPTLPGDTIAGQITYIGSAAVEANAFPVKVKLVEPDAKIKPGMTAEVILTIEKENRSKGYLVPLQALLPTGQENKGYAFVYDPDTSTVVKTPVHALGTEKKMAIVDEGLKEGDIIAVAGVSFLADGMVVKLIEK
jgi:RND family efflux transporter MFP subunit